MGLGGGVIPIASPAPTPKVSRSPPRTSGTPHLAPAPEVPQPPPVAYPEPSAVKPIILPNPVVQEEQGAAAKSAGPVHTPLLPEIDALDPSLLTTIE